MNPTSSLLEDIRNVNLSYLLLVQRLLNEDRDQAMFRLKLEPEMAKKLSDLPVSELAKLASSSQLLCHFALDSTEALTTLTGEGRTNDLQRTHEAILLAGRSDASEKVLSGGKRRG
ncbi:MULTISPECIES: flagellar transcriptional regulator FlhD [Larsenimonas]|uniref:Flagellar transcriptional regulator FlhD n=1 Tax=Larsenimonas suaedae TaxID=1851019 RepID=A0ABU1GX25_9GAMM|nr:MULTISPECIES: flagellar transcriptional regulator FlhD [Larsenimonas]MCM2971283.1 flagellar transcriptional regulator FlhD [Larsenimonas suaedae]MCM5703390.1 flagellar transcriptional regulator FlhD [Larsenimonas salina]MDR5895992.1 flagellar transcriptional regulator FlhD [Larsenimonas suaedae]